MVTRDNLTIQQLMEILPVGYSIKGISTNRTCCLLFSRPNYSLTDFDPKNPKISDLLLSPTAGTNHFDYLALPWAATASMAFLISASSPK